MTVGITPLTYFGLSLAFSSWTIIILAKIAPSGISEIKTTSVGFSNYWRLPWKKERNLPWKKLWRVNMTSWMCCWRSSAPCNSATFLLCNSAYPFVFFGSVEHPEDSYSSKMHFPPVCPLQHVNTAGLP